VARAVQEELVVARTRKAESTEGTATAGHGDRAKGLEELLTVDEAARALRVSLQFIYRHAHDGDLPSVSVGKSVRIKVSTIRAIIDGDLELARPRPSGDRRSRRLVALPDRL
jgi:excisionase family DNA binding protein